jgi:hypothetical protein
MSAHTFGFFRAGGFDQVHFASGDDLVKLAELDQKLWVALACPTKGLVLDARTVDLLDADHDGRIRAQELVTASSWLGTVLSNRSTLLEGKDELVLAHLSTSEEGRRLGLAARSVLDVVGKPAATSLTVADVMAATKAFDARPFNGDGVVPPASATDLAARQLAAEVVDCTGGVADRSGAMGFNQATADAFFKAIAEHAAWLDLGTAEVCVLGEATAGVRDMIESVRTKVDDYFARARLASFDPRSAAAMNRDEKDYALFATKELSREVAEIAALPLARVEAGRALPLTSAQLNPAWASRVADFAAKALPKGTLELTEAAWGQLLATFVPFDAWRAKKAGATVEKLGPARVRELAKAGARAPLDALLTQEKEQEPIAGSLASVERLARYHRDLHRVALNFVNFRDFYAKKQAAFQVGTLYLDQRACELCLRVEDTGRHATMAPLSRAYLAYCDVSRTASAEKMTIVAAFTAGDSDNLMVGRNGVFVDRDGKDWDATITKLVENPISIRQAFWSPYKKLLRFIEEQIAKRAGEADKGAQDTLTTGATEVGKAGETGNPSQPKKLDIGVVAALGVAVGGITAALGALLQAFFGLGLFMPIGLLGALLLISGPSMLIAGLKLRQRNIGPLLDASGWAVNANAKLNVPFGASLTHVAALPRGAVVDRRDPYQEKQRPWGLWLLLVVALSVGVAWFAGSLDSLLPEAMRRHPTPAGAPTTTTTTTTTTTP